MFRPLPLLTLFALPSLALLGTLGVWQVQRAQWKSDQIAGYEALEAQPPAPLSRMLCDADAPETLSGPALRDLAGEGELRIWDAGPLGEPGWVIVALAAAPDCDPMRRVLVQTGFQTLDGPRRDAPDQLMLEPWPRTGPFTPENMGASGDYFRFDRADFAAGFGAAPGSLLPVWARWEERGALERARTAPADHIGYAVTWFGLAAALIAIYVAVHVRRGRVGRRRD